MIDKFFMTIGISKDLYDLFHEKLSDSEFELEIHIGMNEKYKNAPNIEQFCEKLGWFLESITKTFAGETIALDEVIETNPENEDKEQIH